MSKKKDLEETYRILGMAGYTIGRIHLAIVMLLILIAFKVFDATTKDMYYGLILFIIYYLISGLLMMKHYKKKAIGIKNKVNKNKGDKKC